MEVVNEGSAKSGHSVAGFRIKISGPDLKFRPTSLPDPKPTGRQLIEAAGFSPADNYGILQWLPSGDLESIRLNETVDLRGDGAERFIVAESDRAFFFELDGERQEWLAPIITGLTLKKLNGKDPDSVIVFFEREDEPDVEIDDDEVVNLGGAGLERFHTSPLEKIVTITVNTKPVEMTRGDHTGLQIKQAAIEQGVNIKIDFILSLEKRKGEEKTIGDSDVQRVKRGQVYTAIADDDNS